MVTRRSEELDAVYNWEPVEDMYYSLSEDEQVADPVMSAYLDMSDLYMQVCDRQENPVDNSGVSAFDGGGATTVVGNFQAITAAETGKQIAAGTSIQYTKIGGQDNVIRILPQTVTYTYGDSFKSNGLTVEYSTSDSRSTQEIEKDIQAAIDGLSFILYAPADGDGQNPTDVHCNAGTYPTYVDNGAVSVTVNGLNYTIIDGSNLDSSKNIRNDAGVTINKRQIYIVPHTTYVTKGNTISQINYTVMDTNGGLVDGDLLPADVLTTENFDKDTTGSYKIILGSSAKSNTNYNVDIQANTGDVYVVVSERTLTLTPVFVFKGNDGVTTTGAKATRQYGQVNPAVDFVITGWSDADKTNFEYKTNNEHKSNAVALKEMLGLSGEPTVVLPSITSAPGGYTVTIGNIQTDAPINGYNIQLATATFEITKRNVTITNDQIDAVYGESEKSKSSTITFDAVSYNGAAQAVSSEKRIVPGNTITADDGVNQLVAMVLTTSRQDPDNKNVGEYPMSVEVPPACTAYYDVKVINSKYIIHPAMLTVTLSNLSAMYGAARNGKIESIDGFKWNDTQDNQPTNSVKLSEPDGKNMLIVHQMPLTITPRYGLSKTYGETDPSFAVNDTYVIFDYNTTSFAEPKADFAQARLSREAGENAGTYPIYSGDIFEQPMAKNYRISFTNDVRFTINKRTAVINLLETENPDFTVNAVATNGDGTHGAAVKPDSLGLKMALVYTPFENDKTTDNAQTAPLTADAKATLTPDIASGDDGVESDSQFKTENVKNAGTYTYTVSSDYDAAVEQNYAVTIKVVDADKNEADGQFVIARKDLTVTLDPNPSTKLYGTKTVIPEVKTSGYAFDESVETVKLPAFELIVASSVDGIFGNVGQTKDAFKYVGGSYDNYNYLPATGDLEVKRLKLDDVKEPITITGTVFDEKTGKNVEVTKNFGDDLSKLYFNSAVEVSAPEGYAIGTSDSLTDADWAEKMVISDNGTKVTSDFYLIDLTTGAITSVGTVTSSIDTVVPVTISAFTANAVDAATKTDLMNEKFTKFETAINIFITGEEIGKAPVKEDDKKTDDTEKKDDADKKDETEKKDETTAGDKTTDESKKDETVDKSEAETQRVAHGKPTKDKTEKQSVVEVKASVPAISKLDGEYNSGVAKIQYYKVNGTNIVKDTEGNYTFDESKFETVDVKNISKDNGYVSFNLSPDWTGYIVTRTVDKAGNYGDVRVMSVKLENPPAPETPRATATPAPAEEKPAPKLIVAAQAPTGVGLSANIVIPVVVVVALIAVGAVVIVKKKGGKKEEAAEKTEDKPEEKSEDESKEDKQ